MPLRASLPRAPASRAGLPIQSPSVDEFCPIPSLVPRSSLVLRSGCAELRPLLHATSMPHHSTPDCVQSLSNPANSRPTSCPIVSPCAASRHRIGNRACSPTQLQFRCCCGATELDRGWVCGRPGVEIWGLVAAYAALRTGSSFPVSFPSLFPLPYSQLSRRKNQKSRGIAQTVLC
jgi:hypothetical protein